MRFHNHSRQKPPPTKNSSRGGGNYDLLTAFHVIEHLADPIGILRQLASLLKDNGKMIIEVPNANDALLSIYKNKAFSEFTYWSPHLYLYNPHTLRKLGEKAGLVVDFVKCIQRYPLSNTLYWLSNGLPAGQKIWGGFLDSKILQESYESALASVGATDTLIAQFRKR
ncbi:class I SAM-dependent methyltransferase [uncultured Helicobacter sp.]|uniref:class I SAM-dependent methyltransferase n=1 Tax=uncultured Helicobacter sp. TaxID=175537 RepID=UPI00374EA74D